jgi:hypothetical protein
VLERAKRVGGLVCFLFPRTVRQDDVRPWDGKGSGYYEIDLFSYVRLLVGLIGISVYFVTCSTSPHPDRVQLSNVQSNENQVENQKHYHGLQVEGNLHLGTESIHASTNRAIPELRACILPYPPLAVAKQRQTVCSRRKRVLLTVRCTCLCRAFARNISRTLLGTGRSPGPAGSLAALSAASLMSSCSAIKFITEVELSILRIVGFVYKSPSSFTSLHHCLYVSSIVMSAWYKLSRQAWVN